MAGIDSKTFGFSDVMGRTNVKMDSLPDLDGWKVLAVKDAMDGYEVDEIILYFPTNDPQFDKLPIAGTVDNGNISPESRNYYLVLIPFENEQTEYYVREIKGGVITNINYQASTGDGAVLDWEMQVTIHYESMKSTKGAVDQWKHLMDVAGRGYFEKKPSDYLVG